MSTKDKFWAALEKMHAHQEYLNGLAEADRAFAADAEQAIAEFESGSNPTS
jgi:hypothetical protein